MNKANSGKEDGGASDSRSSSWRPCPQAFVSYTSSAASDHRSSSLRVITKRPLVARLTKDIVETYQICNPLFKYDEALNPKRFLTNPSVGVLNDGNDNANSDLILYAGFVLVNVRTQQRYIVKDILGQGTFGQVAKCWVSETNSFVAVKIIKNQPAYHRQALVEVSILTMLNQKFDPQEHHIVRILDCFVCQGHLCISFEMLGLNLYEIIRMKQFRGLSTSIVQMFSKQILHALLAMKDARIIHCDLKPENILISTSVKPAEIKVIDFGSACMEDWTVYSYIQSRYYRSPEVVLGYPYTAAIDMWSFGCIVAELFLGLPLFPGASEFDILKRMIEILGGQPPDYILRIAKNTDKFFKRIGSIHQLEDDEPFNGGRSSYKLLTEEEYEARESKKPAIGKHYFNHAKLEDIVANYPHQRNLTGEEICSENLTRSALIDFLRGLIEFDPDRRWSPLQAVHHPFVTGKPFTCPYRPPIEKVSPEKHHLNVMVDHNPGGGHWFVAGLSPQVTKVNKGLLHNSPHFQMGPLSYASSPGSLGSYDSFNGGSYGSYGDNNSMHMYYSSVGPSGMNIQARGGLIVGTSPDARQRASQLLPGNGYGVSPSTGSFGPMSLGASPSQFTPSSPLHAPAGSPGNYGPSSPLRGSVQGLSLLGKVATTGHRRSLGYHETFCNQPQGNTSSHHRQWHHTDGTNSEGSPRNMQSISSLPSWKQQRGGNGISSQSSSALRHAPSLISQVGFLPSSEPYDKPECSSSPPDPGHWDPNYSDELLLQEDCLDVSSLTSRVRNGMHLVQTSGSAPLTGGASRFNHDCNIAPSGPSCISNIRSETSGPVRSHLNVERSPPSALDAQAGYAHCMSNASYHMPHFLQNPLGRSAQQPSQQFSYVQRSYIHGDWNPHNDQATPDSSNKPGPHSPGKSNFSTDEPWGRRAAHPITTILPLSRARRDYKRIG
ncbi:hypothetical protein AAC387_Pa06g0241 [Persea americana]